MGWCSGTEIFDNVVKKLIEIELPEEQLFEVAKVLLSAMEGLDYDCWSDSAYYGTPLMDKVMLALGHELDEYEDDMD